MQPRVNPSPTSAKDFSVRLVLSEREKMVRVALYARVSTAEKGQDPRVQTLELRSTASTVAGASLASMWI